MKKILCLLLLCCLCISHSEAQDYQIGLMPALNLNKSFKQNWKINLNIESRQRLATRSEGQSFLSEYEYQLTDLTTIVSRKVGLRSQLAVGYLLRFRQNRLVHRAIQQFAIVRKYEGFRLGHRLVSDQTFEDKELAELRLRYRLAGELPLNGLVVNQNEMYLKMSNEYLHKLDEQVYDLEVRGVAALGLAIKDNNKIELGIDYRVDSFVSEGITENDFWLTLEWFVAF